MGAVTETELIDEGAGLIPKGEGWFIVNSAEAAGLHTDTYGEGVRFEGSERFPGFGINIRLLQPGQPASVYHREDVAEAFVVLSGECVAVIEDEERTMRKGDFLYTPPGTAHVIVGSGAGPSTVLMAGAREAEGAVSFPVSEAAARYGASVERETDDFAEAYKNTGDLTPTTVELDW
jgi:uncharacterized cupin superfamily protein